MSATQVQTRRQVEVPKIASEEEYEKAVEKIEALWDSPVGTPEHEALNALIELVHEYEDGASEDLLAG